MKLIEVNNKSWAVGYWAISMLKLIDGTFTLSIESTDALVDGLGIYS